MQARAHVCKTATRSVSPATATLPLYPFLILSPYPLFATHVILPWYFSFFPRCQPDCDFHTHPRQVAGHDYILERPSETTVMLRAPKPGFSRSCTWLSPGHLQFYDPALGGSSYGAEILPIDHITPIVRQPDPQDCRAAIHQHLTKSSDGLSRGNLDHQTRKRAHLASHAYVQYAICLIFFCNTAKLQDFIWRHRPSSGWLEGVYGPASFLSPH